MTTLAELLIFILCICLCVLGIRWNSPTLTLLSALVVGYQLLESNDPL
jgi:hypothetical protein